MGKSIFGVALISLVLLAIWSYFSVDSFLSWEERAGEVDPRVDRSYLDTTTDFLSYLAGNHSLQDDGEARWEGEYKSLTDSRLTLAGLAVLVPTLLYLSIWAQGVTFSVTVAAGVSLYCGLAHLLVLVGQLAGRALKFVEASSLAYDFSTYTFILYCTLLAIFAVTCTRSSGGLMRGENKAWKTGLWSCGALVALNAPLLPIWTVPGLTVGGLAGIALPACLAGFSLLVLGLTGANFSFDRND